MAVRSRSHVALNAPGAMGPDVAIVLSERWRIDGVLFDDEVRLQQQHAGKLDPDRAGCLLFSESSRCVGCSNGISPGCATKDLREQSGAPFIGLGGGWDRHCVRQVELGEARGR
jgi:hypothetical protein